MHLLGHSRSTKSLPTLTLPGKQKAWKFSPTGKASHQDPVLRGSGGAGQIAIGFILTAHSVRHLAHYKQNHRFSGHSKFFHFRKFPDAEQTHSISLQSCRVHTLPLPVEVPVVFKILLTPFSLDVFNNVILQEFF